jgi:glucokinase
MARIGLDLGGTKLASAVFSAAGEIVARDTAALGGRRGAEVATLMVERLEALRAAGSRKTLEAVGVSVPGLYHADRGTVWAPNIQGWDDFPLRDTLRAALGARVRIVIDSDRAAYILGETWRGAATGAKNAVFLAVGTGIGAGILVDGAVLRGTGDVAGAIGWLALERPFQDKWRPHGNFEHQASGPGLVRVARELMAGDRGYTGELRHLGQTMTAEHLFAAHDRGDALATRVIENAIELWGMASANLVSLFNPETIVFGGGVFGPATKFIDRIRDEATRWAQPIGITQVRFVASALGNDAGVYGAGRLTTLKS